MNANIFMTAKIGGSAIVNEDINKFFAEIKDIDWTDNNIYKPAKICEVKPTFTINNNHSYAGGYQSKISLFDQFLIEDNSNHLNDFRAYKNDYDDRMTKVNEKINTQKNDFIQLLSSEGIDDLSDKQKILDGIRKNISKIISNTKLKDKLGHLANSIEQNNMNMNNANNMNNIPFQNQPINYMNNQNFMNQNQFMPNPGMINNPNQQQWMNYNNQGNFNNNFNMNNFNQYR